MQATMPRISSIRTVVAGSANQACRPAPCRSRRSRPRPHRPCPSGWSARHIRAAPCESATVTRKASVQGTLRKPSTKRSEVVKPTSNRPPRMRSAHAMRERISARPAPALACRHAADAAATSSARFRRDPDRRRGGRDAGDDAAGRRSLSRRRLQGLHGRLRPRRLRSSCSPAAHLLRIDDPTVIRDHAASNDANRADPAGDHASRSCAAILVAVAMETLGGGRAGRQDQAADRRHAAASPGCSPTRSTRSITPISIYARAGRRRSTFPATEPPGYADFVYFAFTLGMTFQTSDVDIARPAASAAW